MLELILFRTEQQVEICCNNASKLRTSVCVSVIMTPYNYGIDTDCLLLLPGWAEF